MRKIAILTTFLLFSVTIFYSIFQKETLLKNGEVVRLKLAPVDPRSIMQGDYMILRYKIANTISQKIMTTENENFLPKVVVSVDKNRVATFKRLYKNKKLSKDEMILNFQYKKSRFRVSVFISTNSYFFQEGKRERFQKAKFGEFKVDKNGVALLTGVLDQNLKKL